MRFSENAPSPVLPSYAPSYRNRAPQHSRSNFSSSDAPKSAWQHDMAGGAGAERFVAASKGGADEDSKLGARAGRYEDRDKAATTEEENEAVAVGQAGVEAAVDEGPVMEEEEAAPGGGGMRGF